MILVKQYNEYSVVLTLSDEGCLIRKIAERLTISQLDVTQTVTQNLRIAKTAHKNIIRDVEKSS